MHNHPLLSALPPCTSPCPSIHADAPQVDAASFQPALQPRILAKIDAILARDQSLAESIEGEPRWVRQAKWARYLLCLLPAAVVALLLWLCCCCGCAAAAIAVLALALHPHQSTARRCETRRVLTPQQLRQSVERPPDSDEDRAARAARATAPRTVTFCKHCKQSAEVGGCACSGHCCRAAT